MDWPGEDAVAADLWVALDRQTGKLDQANDRTAASIGIVKRCEERDREAMRRAGLRWWQRIF